MASRLSVHEFESISGDGEGQGSLVCCSLWGSKELDLATEQQQKQGSSINNIKLIMMMVPCFEGTCCLVKYLELCYPVYIKSHETIAIINLVSLVTV